MRQLIKHLFCRTIYDHRTIDGKTWSVIEYTLTLRERLSILVGFIKANLICGCIADYISEDLEEVLCGYVPARHRVCKHFDGYVKGD